MKTGHKRLTGRAAALLALALMAGHAAASQSWDVSQACGQAHRIDRATATCLNGAWDNSPGLWSGYAGGSDHWVQSVCSNHGLVYASVDIAGQLDKKYKLDNAAKQTSISLTSNVRAIACCINHGDQLCFKNQVEKNASWEIRHVTVSGSGYSETTTDVSTHAKRYKFCQDHPNDIYCKVNPEGDALTNPYNCGDHFCTAGDCTWHWERSDAYDSCLSTGSGYSMRISASDGTSQRCTITAQCENGYSRAGENGAPDTLFYQSNEFSAEVWHFDNLVNCSGYLKVRSC